MRRWFFIGVVTAIAIAWLATVLHLSGHAPFGILSLGVGAALGAILYAVAVILRIAGPRRLVFGVFILALVTAVAQHAWLYRDFRRQWHEARDRSPQMAIFREEKPWTPGEYFRREMTWKRAALWATDAMLIAAGALGTTLLLDHKRQ